MKVLIPVEDEIFANEIFEFVKNHSWPANCQFKIVNVQEPFLIQEMVSPIAADEMVRLMECGKAEGDALVSSLATRIKKQIKEAKIEYSVLNGLPKQLILDLIKTWQPNLVIMGSHGRGAIGRLILGSISSTVLTSAKCSVVIIKPPLPEEDLLSTKVESHSLVKGLK